MRSNDLILTASAPTIWGSTYIVTATLLPPGLPFSMAALRALPAGLLLFALVPALPTGKWWIRAILLGLLNIGIFWPLLFLAAYRLPGGVAAMVGATQPLLVIALARIVLKSPIRALAILAGVMGIAGVSLLVLSPTLELDAIGLMAAFCGTLSMGIGTVLSRLWKPDVSVVAFTSWQLIVGGLVLVPPALFFEPELPVLKSGNIAGIAYLSLIGSAFTFFIWQRGIARLPTTTISTLGLLSPLTALMLGWIILGQALDFSEAIGACLILASVWLGHLGGKPRPQSLELTGVKL